MTDHHFAPVVHSVIVEEEVRFTLMDLCRTCRADTAQVIELVDEGVLEPAGGSPGDWQFSGPELRRARAALRLSRDLELSSAGTALVLDLLDEIAALKSRLRRTGAA